MGIEKVRKWQEDYVNTCPECKVNFVVYYVSKPEQELVIQVADYCYNCGAPIEHEKDSN